MKKVIRNQYFRIAAIAVIILGTLSMGFRHNDKNEGDSKASQSSDIAKKQFDSGSEKSEKLPGVTGELPACSCLWQMA